MSQPAKRGRPYQNGHSKKIAVGYRLLAWLVAWLRSRPETATELIEDALRARHHLKPPPFPHDQCKTRDECRQAGFCLDAWACSSGKP